MCTLKENEKARLVERNTGVHFELMYNGCCIAKDSKGFFIAVLDDKFDIITRHYGNRQDVNKVFKNFISNNRMDVSILKNGLIVKKKHVFKPFVMCKEVYNNWFI